MGKQMSFVLSEKDRNLFSQHLAVNDIVLISPTDNGMYETYTRMADLEKLSFVGRIYIVNNASINLLNSAGNVNFSMERNVIDSLIEWLPCTLAKRKDEQYFIPGSRIYLQGKPYPCCSDERKLYDISLRIYNELMKFIKSHFIISTIGHYVGKDALRLYSQHKFQLEFIKQMIFFKKDILNKYCNKHREYFDSKIDWNPFISD
jgi:hypothetical protein